MTRPAATVVAITSAAIGGVLRWVTAPGTLTRAVAGGLPASGGCMDCGRGWR
ncbi:MAG: hypothetical protein ACM3ZF_11260 [Mycobacterium leprae]